MKFIKTLVVLVFIFFVFIPLVIYLYFFTGTPKNLGIKFTPEDYTQGYQKVGTEIVSATGSVSVKDSLQFSGKKESKISLTSSEITGYLNGDKYIYAPISNIQVKINPDGTGEISGILNLKNFITYVSLTTPTDDIQKAIDKFHISANPPFYAKGTLVVTNNQVNFNFTSLEIGRIPIPQDYVSQNIGALNDYATKKLNSIPNLQVRSLTLSDSQAHLDAIVPEKVIKAEK